MAKKKGRPAKKEPKNPAPRQKSLPGMQDGRVAVLERAALRYADIRDERMDWTKKEVEAKKRVQNLMHDQKRQRYVRANIEIELVPEDEHVRVRIHDREQTERAPVDEPVERPPAVEEPESPEEQPVEEPDPDTEYDSKENEPPSEF